MAKKQQVLTDSELRTLAVVKNFGDGATWEELKQLGAYKSALDWLVKYKYLKRGRSANGAVFSITELGRATLKAN